MTTEKMFEEKEKEKKEKEFEMSIKFSGDDSTKIEKK